MFDDPSLNKPTQAPGNLPMGEPEDMFADTEKTPDIPSGYRYPNAGSRWSRSPGPCERELSGNSLFCYDGFWDA